MNARLWLGLPLAAVAAIAVWAVFRPPQARSETLAFETSRACASCHQEAWAEWSSSQHAQAWVNPDVRALSNDFANKDCIDCHAPRPVFETGIGNRVLPRATRRAEGVDCIACHLVPATREGEPPAVAGTLDRRDAPCNPRIVRELATPDFCAGCHDQHKTVQQWRESEWFQRGIDCLDCHMPERERAGGGRGRDHRCLGGHDEELVRSAVELRATLVGEEFVVEVENSGAGHSFPTDERSRAADLFWRPLGAGPDAPWRHLYRFRSPYRHEVDIPETLLPAHAVQRSLLPRSEAPDGLEAALFYKLSPYWNDPERPDPEREARLVHRVEARP